MTPKIYINGSCVTLAKTLGGVGYRVFLLLIPLSSNINVTGTAACIQEQVHHILSEIGLGDVLYIFSVHVMRRNHSTHENNTIAEDYYVVYFEMYLPLNMIAIYMTQASSIDKLLQLHGDIITLQCQPFATVDFFVRLDYFETLEKSQNVSETLLFHTDSVCQCKTPLVRVSPQEFVRQHIHGFELYDESTVIDLKSTYNCSLIKLNASFYDLNHTAWGVVIQAYSVALNMSEYSTACAGNLSDVCVCKATLNDIAAHVLNTSPAVADDMLIVLVVHIILYIAFTCN